MDIMTKGERIRELRKAKKITQIEMAKKLHTTKQTISKYEKGIVTNIPSDRLEDMARMLDTTPEYILGWKEASVSEKEKSDVISDITDRMFDDDAFLSVVESLHNLPPEQFNRANSLLNLFFKEAFNEVEN